MQGEPNERLWRSWPGSVTHGYARAFGDRGADVDLDFTGTARAELVSALLIRCLRSHDGSRPGDDVWSWTLAQRLQGLLAITQASGVPPIALLQRCGSCAEALEISLEPRLFEREETLTDFTWSPDPDRTLRVALPTGHEQREWSRGNGSGVRAMARALVREVDGAVPSADWEIPEAWVDGLAEALEQRDPLTALELETACPACGAPAGIAIDLEAELLARLHACQRRMLNDIHRLASAYHWSEAHILELPPWRRRHYLAQCGVADGA